MAYYSGQASSYQELMNVLVSACVTEAWTWADGILNKGGIFVKPTVNLTAIINKGSGLLLQAGTGKSGINLLNPSPGQVRIGSFGLSPLVPDPVFPLNYHIFIFNNEVYLVIKYSIDRFFWLAFGSSNITNTMWFSGTLALKSLENAGGSKSININLNTAGDVQSGGYPSSSGFFLQTYDGGSMNATDVIYEPNLGWLGGEGSSTVGHFSALYTTQPIWSRLPSVWSQESVLLPINPIIRLASSKYMIFCDVQNARYVRIDNYEPEQIIQLGSERWMILPFHKKNVVARNGGTNIDHTGTFGWAIRYDGP